MLKNLREAVRAEATDRTWSQGVQLARDQRVSGRTKSEKEIVLDVRVPGRPGIVVNRQHEADVFVALRDAFDAASRRLEETFHESRPDAGAPAPGQAP